MKLRAHFAVVIAASLLCILPLAAQNQNIVKLPIPVTVTNTSKNPVPTVSQGTANVNVTNNPLPVSGDVNVSNTPLPVSGSVTVGNLPLDSNGNVLVDLAPDTSQYQYLSILASVGVTGLCQNSYGEDFCANVNGQWVPIEQVLTTLSGQGYELFSVVTACPNNACAGGGANMLYTLRAPVMGARSKRSSMPVKQ